MKKISFSVFAAASVLALSACGESAEAPAETETEVVAEPAMTEPMATETPVTDMGEMEATDPMATEEVVTEEGVVEEAPAE